jgi:hypothetical protein
MSILVLPPRYTPDTIALGKAAARLGWHVERLSSWRVPAELRDKEVAVYAEPLFVSVVSEPLGIEVLEPTHAWLPDLPEKYRKRSVRLSTLGDARNLCEAAFIKPVSDKTFVAKVYASGKDLPPAPTDLGDAEAVLISEPVEWELEFRAFVLEQSVVTLSPYLRFGRLVEQPDGSWPASEEECNAADAFCRTVLADADVPCPPAVVLDVGVIAGRGWAVIEANAVWGSGLYGCEPSEVLRTVRRSCVPRGRVSAGDRKWLRP